MQRRQGHIVNVASGAGIIGLTEPPPYISSKFAVVGLSEALFRQLNIFNINVSVVIPSYIKTDIYLKSEIKYPQKLIEDVGEEKLKEISDDLLQQIQSQAMSTEKAVQRYIEGIKNLKNLKKLYLDGNYLEDLDGIEVLENLEILILNFNSLGKIKHLSALTNLKELNLDDNGIEKIENLENLVNLETLSLSYNDIKKIENLENLKNLRKLDLDSNNIIEIKGIQELINLRILNLNDNNITHIEGLENLENLKEFYVWDNPLKEEEEKYLINSEAPLKAIINYCRTKKLETDEIKILDDYDSNKSFNENINNIKKSLQKEDISDLINIGTHLEKKEIAIMQNLIFYHQSPEEINLKNKKKEITELKINLIQINSLKGVNSGKSDKIEHFLFFMKQYWDKDELENNALVYEQNSNLIDSKIKEFLKLSLLTNPDLIIFPENSVPYRMKNYLIKFSEENSLIIVCGLEHKKAGSHHINKSIIIDNGKCGEQIKQTPVEIKKHDGNHIRENIKCQIFPKIKIFLTSIGRIAIFICKDFLRLFEKISGWARKNKIDYIIIPSLTGKILPFHTKLINLLNYTNYKRLKFILSSIAEYGGSEFFSIDQIKCIESSFRNNNRDNIGEVIVSRNYVYHGKNVEYNEENGLIYIKCRKCGLKYSVITNGAHILEENATNTEKDRWEFYLKCRNCGCENYRY